MRRFFLGLAMTGIATLSPAWAMGGDQEVAQEIAANLRTSGKMKGYSIGVKVSDGTAWLGGTVRSEKQLKDALDIASSTPGVTKVVNELSIESPTVAQQSSAAPARKAASRPAVQQVGGATQNNRAQLATQEVELESGPTAPFVGNQPRPLNAVPAQQMRPVSAPMPAHAAGYPAPGYGGPMPMHAAGPVGPGGPARFDHPQMPGYAWPSYAAHPNYAALTYPKQYSPTAWPFIGPFYPYPQVPLGWRKVTLEWDDGWWMLDFKD